METTTLNNTLGMLNTRNNLQNEANKSLQELTKSLDECADVSQILDKWFLRNYMTKDAQLKTWELQPLKDYILKRAAKQVITKKQKEEKRILNVMESGDLIGIDLQIEWKKSAMWGMNPKATARVYFTDKNGNRDSYSVESGSIGGSGYDKASTAVANCLNQVNELLKPMYLLKDENPTVKNHELFGYGSGYGFSPSIEGGVGVSCYYKIMDKIGFTFETVASGKTFDVYRINKKQ